MAKKDACRRMLVAVGLVVAALAYSGCSNQEAAEDDVDPGGSLVSEEGRVAFTHAAKLDWSDVPSSQADVHAIDVDGSGERRLTDSPGLDGFPAWSPDGERIAFVSARDGGNCEVYLMDADGSGQRRLTRTPEDEFFLAWSPDGKRIAYGTDPTGRSAIWVMDSDGSGHKRLATGLFPSWSPDGERIAYTAYWGERPYIAVMDADDGSGRRSLGSTLIERATGRVYDEEPAWSPDGEQIAFASYAEKDNEEIFVMNSDGSGRTRLTERPGADHWPPTWSPDGTRIAFTSDGTEGRGEIYVMNADGSGLTKLTDDPAAEDFYPAWRP